MNAAAVLLLVAGITVAARAQQPIVVGRNVQVSKAHSDREHSEVIIAAHPNDAKHLLAGAMVGNRKFGGMDVITYVSFDGGMTWQPTLKVETEFGFNGDPAPAIGCDGSAYMLNGTIIGTGNDLNHWQVHRSRDGGRTWLPPAELRWSDRGYITVDCSNSKYRGRVYVIAQGAMTATDKRPVTGTRVWVSRDSGATFSEWNFPPAAGRQATFQGPPVVLSDGTFLGPMVDRPADRSNSAGGDIIRVIHSEDGGNRFDNGAYVVAELPVRSIGFPKLAVDRSTGPFRDRVYALWEAGRSADSRRGMVWMAHSSDKGKTWSTPIVVSDADTSSTSLGVYMGEVAVNRNGVVGVLWYERFDPSHPLDFRPRFAVSLDGGASFTASVPVSDAAFVHAAHKSVPIGITSFGGGSILTSLAGPIIQIGAGVNRFFENGGDTAGLVADANGVFHSMWVDNRTGVAQMWTAPVRVNGVAARRGGLAESTVSAAAMPADSKAVLRDTTERLGSLEDVTAAVMMQVGDVHLDPATKTLSGTAYLLNTSEKPITGPLVTRVMSVDLAGAEVLNADNRQPGVGATWDFTASLRANRLAPGERTRGKRIEIRVPDATFQTPFPRLTARVFGNVDASAPSR